MSDLATNILIALHLGFLAIAAMGVLLADHLAWRWMRGKPDSSHGRKILRIHKMVTVGLSGLVLSGLILFWPLREYLLTQPLFWIKMVFVCALIINSFFIEYFMHLPARRSFASLRAREKTRLFLSGAISTVSWVSAAGMAILLFRWPFL